MDNAESNTNRRRFKLIRAKEVIKFFCLFILIYVLLMPSWQIVGAVYSKAYAAGGRILFGSFGSGGIVRFRQSDDGKHDIYIIALNRLRVDQNGKIPVIQFWRSIRYGDYIHIAFMAALIVATPISLRRRAWALFWGLILMHAFITCKLAITLVNLFSSKRLSLFVLSPFWRDVVVIANLVVVRDVTTGFVVSVFIWALVSFRRRDLAGLLMHKKDISKVKGEK